ncbi:DNA-binding protein [Paenibacillus sp. PK3_47]|uniref:DNA-binding protein n=1 Tax=Paenibacillus sp. PK3_47 TaxID=2072642 RepID=UPI00201DCF8A|nr:DNA-binding protein [Paenibacillus sp. PK3_47]UQZ32826.1 DNA-binding protein [Paenibacillus sp. PK3_47]
MLDLDGVNADSLTDMIKMSFSWENWLAIIEISDKLLEVSAIAYDSMQLNLSKHLLKRSIAYYFGYSQCMKGIALQKLNRLPEARQCITQYSNLSWIKGLNEEGLAEVEYYRNIATANTYVLDLLEGKSDILPDYVEFIRNNDQEELIAGLITVLESSVKHNYSIDWVLEEFKDQVEELSSKEKREDVRYYVDYLYLQAVYLYKRDRISDAINLILDILKIGGKLNDKTGFRKTVAFYEFIRSHASLSQQERHREIMQNILEREFLKNEKSMLVVNSRIVD